MPIQYQAISEEEYKSLRYQILLNVEEGGDVALTPYRDSKGNVTIGIGFNLRDTGVRLAVLDFFGIAEDSASYLTIEAILSRVWEPEQMDDVRAALDAAIAQSGQRTQFAFTDEAEVKTFFGTFIADYETYVNNNLPAVPQFSRERAVLLSLHSERWRKRLSPAKAKSRFQKRFAMRSGFRQATGSISSSPRRVS